MNVVPDNMGGYYWAPHTDTYPSGPTEPVWVPHQPAVPPEMEALRKEVEELRKDIALLREALAEIGV